jgi:hypothetical protein
MDPYLERRPIWPDFHNGLVRHIQEALQPQLRPRYVALGQDRLFVVESDRPIYPDVSVLRTGRTARPSPTSTAVLEVDVPAVFELWREEFKEPLIHIIEPAAGNRLITAIEVLSPDNKEAGEGRKSYLGKREELWGNGANVVEIDLWHGGEPTVRVSSDHLDSLRPWHYLVAVTRQRPSRQEVYAVTLQQRLPRVAIPLAEDDRDVVLDLQATFTRCWDGGPYPELLQYEGSPPGKVSPDDVAWCKEVLCKAGFRPASQPKSKPKKKKP